MTTKKKLDSGLTPPETTEKKPDKLDKIVEQQALMMETLEAVRDGVRELVKQMGEQIKAVNLEKRRGKFGMVNPPDIPARGVQESRR